MDLVLGSPDLIGRPFNYRRTVNSGAGGNIEARIVVPTGEVWIAKYMTAYHDDAVARQLVFYIDDLINAIIIQMPIPASVTTNVRADFLSGSWLTGALILSPGALEFYVTAQALAANKNINIELHGHKIYGAWPLV
jgi:hypothetical protein